MTHQDEQLGAPPLPYGPYAVGEALAMASRMIEAGRKKLAAHLGRQLEVKGAVQ